MHGKTTTGHMEKNGGREECAGRSPCDARACAGYEIRRRVRVFIWSMLASEYENKKGRRDDEMKGGDLERKGHKERLQGLPSADRRTEAVRRPKGDIETFAR